jgi:antitoxin ParD1/3/4
MPPKEHHVIARTGLASEETLALALAERLATSVRYGSVGDVIDAGVRLVAEREKRLEALDAALARGVADAEAGRVHPAEEVFAELTARYRAMDDKADDGA